MNFKTIVTFNAILITIFGSAIALFPDMVLEVYGVPVQAPTAFTIWAFTRLLGVVVVSLGILLFAVKNVPASATQASLTIGLLLANLICLLMTYGQRQAIWSIEHNAIGWTTVAFFCFFSVCYTALLINKKENSLSAA